jgi:hypothetical protein
VNNDFESGYKCNLTALDPFQRKRHSELSAEVWPRNLEIKELANGYGFRFPFDVSLFQKIAELMLLEHLCCPFLELGLKLDKNGGPVWVRLTGERGVKSLLRAELGINDYERNVSK